MNTEKVWRSILRLYKWVEKEGYAGWDPYDGLNSKLTGRLVNNEALAMIVIQLNLYSPVNFRPLFRVKKGVANKAVALFARAYLNLFTVSRVDMFREEAERLLTRLENSNLCRDAGMYCCSSYYFPYIAPKHRLDSFIPDIICVTESMKTFIRAYEVLGDSKYLLLAEKASRYLVNRLYASTNGVSYFKYTPLEEGKIVFNITALALEAIAYLLKYKYDDELVERCEKAVGFLVMHQDDSGAWPYSLYLTSNKYYWQIDYHQGFIIDGLLMFMPNIIDNNIRRKTREALAKAIAFYMYRQFDEEGRAYYRYPFKYPVDIHNQAQGIITFTKLYRVTKAKRYYEMAWRIADWTIDNMQSKEGYFYTHKYPFLTNKIPYIRWGQAWMILALGGMIRGI